jgi:hypothetical protein
MNSEGDFARKVADRLSGIEERPSSQRTGTHFYYRKEIPGRSGYY